MMWQFLNLIRWIDYLLINLHLLSSTNIASIFPTVSHSDMGYHYFRVKWCFKLYYSPVSCLQASLVAQLKRICLQCRRHRFDPWVGKIPWRRKWQPTPLSLLGKSHRQRSLVGCSPWGPKESGMTERPTHASCLLLFSLWQHVFQYLLCSFYCLIFYLAWTHFKDPDLCVYS